MGCQHPDLHGAARAGGAGHPTLRMPEGIEPVVALAIGYPGDSQSLGEELRGPQLALETPPRVEEFVFTGVWGRRASALKKPERVHGWLGSPILLPHWG